MAKSDDKKTRESGFSRRDFLKTSATGAVAAGLAGARESVAAQAGNDMTVWGPDAVPIQLEINGSQHRMEVEPRVTLLDALRNHLNLTGSKKVCDRGTCGACTVLLNGSPAYACSVLAIEAQGLRIETVENFGVPENLHPVQAAFVEHDASQCGFCTPGFIVASKALLDRHPQPSEQDMRMGLGGNLCRCGTYAGIRAALEQTEGR